MKATQAIISMAMASGFCMAQADENLDLPSRAAMIQTNMAVCMIQNNVDGLYKVRQQIVELERHLLPRLKDSDQHLEIVSRLHLLIFRATREIDLPADRYDEYVIKKQGYNLSKPMRHPEVARAIAFPSEEVTLITNAVLRQEFDQYQKAKKQMEDNFQKTRMLETIRAQTLVFFKRTGIELPKETRQRSNALLSRQINELIPSEVDRDMLFEIFSETQQMDN